MTGDLPGLMIGLSGLAAAGGWAAGISGPVACRWPARQDELMLRLLAVRQGDRPGRFRTAFGRGLLVILLAAGAAGAYAAQPSAPEALPGEVAGVVGSGDQLSLDLRRDGAARTLKVGQTYADGWILTGLTPTEAALSKGGQTRRVGLNPTGALAAPPVNLPPSTVVMAISADDQVYLDGLIASGEWNGRPDNGATLEETKRLLLYERRIEDGMRAKLAAARLAGTAPDNPYAQFGINALGDSLTDAEKLQVLGKAAYDDLQAIEAKFKYDPAATRAALLADGKTNDVRVMDGLPPVGPDSFYVPAGTNLLAAAKSAGLDSIVGYTFGEVDAKGGMTMTKSQGLPPAPR